VTRQGHPQGAPLLFAAGGVDVMRRSGGVAHRGAHKGHLYRLFAGCLQADGGSLRGAGSEGLPLFVVDAVVGVYGEDVGFVDVVRRSVGIEGADAELVLGGQVVDGDGFAGAGIAAGVEGDRIVGIVVGEDAEFVEEGTDCTVAVAGDEVDAQAGAGLAELDGRGGVEDDGIGGRPRVDHGSNQPVLGRGGRYASAAG